MRENIFKEAKFGDKYITRDGRMVCYTSTVKMGIEIQHWFATNNAGETFCVDINGITFNSYHDYDIVSRYQEPINEDKLDELAESMSKGFWSDDLESFEDNPQRSLIIWAAKRIYECGIKNGYRKAKEE